jgi:hypothetical protein
MARRRIRIEPVRIPQFANVDQISAANYRSYASSSANSPFANVIQSALQIPGGGNVDDVIAEQQGRIDSARQTLSDRSRRTPIQSPYLGRIRSLETAASSQFGAVASDLRAELTRRYQEAIDEERRYSGDFAKNVAREDQRRYQQMLQGMPSVDGAISYQSVSGLRGFVDSIKDYLNMGSGQTYLRRLDSLSKSLPELDELRAESARFEQAANAGIASPLTDAQRSGLQTQIEQATSQIGRVNTEAAARLRRAAARFNEEQNTGAVAASVTRQAPQRPLTGRFGTPQTGVGISIGGFR